MIKDEVMNIEYNLDYTTSKKTAWKNTCEYIMLHHTWSWTFKNMMNYLANHEAKVSCHYVIWKKWEVGRIWLDNYITWHAWTWIYKWIARNKWNYHCIGIEVVSDWITFTKEQIDTMTRLVIELQKKHNIPTENVIRHKDYSPWRKWDIWDNFYKKLWYSNYQEYLNKEIDWKLVPEDNSVIEVSQIEQELKIQKIRNEILRAENERLKLVIETYLDPIHLT